MEALISFTYTGQITLAEANVQSLAKDADYMGVVDIKDKCIEFLASRIYPSNVFQIHELAVSLSCASLKERCYQFMRNCFKNISHTEEYLNLDFIFLKDIMSNNKLRDHSQEKAYNAVMKWIIHDLCQRRAHLEDLLKLIRLSDLTADHLVKLFFKEEMATQEE